MVVKTRKSKLWKLWKLVFPKADMANMWLTFNKTVWTPGYITSDLIKHEYVHVCQQKSFFGAIVWWIKYYFDKKFRYDQELKAYRAQLAYLQSKFKDRNKQSKMKRKIAEVLSSPFYGNLVSYDEAFQDLS